MAGQTIVAGDVGGTKTLLQRVKLEVGTSKVVREARFDSGRYKTFDQLLAEFLSLDSGPIDAACFAVAGPVESGVAKATNLTWRVAQDELAASLSIPRLTVVNDFYAVAFAAPTLTPDDLLTIQKGERALTSPISVLGAGTGLGEAIVLPPEGTCGWRVVPSEGGHSDFAPANAEQSELLLRLQKRYGHVSCERVVSGRGLTNIFEFLRDRDSGHVSLDGESDPSSISLRAHDGDPLASRTFEIFMEAYGAEASNLALKLLSKGGVYIAGGVAAKNSEHFTRGPFLQSFLNKGRFRKLLEGYPLHVIINPNVGLIGAVGLAVSLLES